MPAERAAGQGIAPARTGFAARQQRKDGPDGMSTDLTEAEWVLVADRFKRHGGRGAPPTHERRVLVNACCYVMRTGCAWRLLSKTFPPRRVYYTVFCEWARSGTFERIHNRLCQLWRDRNGRAPDPTASIIDAQSTRSAAQGGNAGKRLKGRKRNLVVDMLGPLLAVTVATASV